MPHTFDADVVSAILRHMNGDHTDDNLLITRAFAPAGGSQSDEITDAVMTDLDGDGGVWKVTRSGEASEIRIPWPSGPITERPAVRREVVALYDLACEKLGVEPRPHA
ncbi:hypothetical protein BMW26_16605 [Microbacterium sp. 1.5R]|uniref:DUF2470 domain-containing protein n=1 Tax=Microbacterium sp. 1.5R TaxID=1916917 RepID=UPI00090C6635|nr:DUF2470 domain-containing protein [Microbacterium sp. 1.5R]APH46871.1 hypothetical protein BMW26_16605 [Microbacterium sp. 1.5R]